ncbi:MAG: 5-(carboxyamino)imidazole ribonucleotide synthase [Bdellovibrionales bacterium]|nr:5-(carboxyamino)imidazole ribonucleotide synthase [Bdellovibrionales bacterium]
MIHLKSQTVLGILGSGQLARMSTLAASDLGIKTHIFCFDSNTSPAEHVASKTIKGSLNDKELLLKFCSECDVITLENEFIDQEILEFIDQAFPGKLFPSSKTFKMIGDKISEKENFQRAGISVTPFMKVTSPQDIIAFTEKFNFPVVLKSSKGGYDGYGNITIYHKDEVEYKMSQLKGELLVEAFIPYEKELAIMIARNLRGDLAIYPIAHTLQENHICHFVMVPAEIDSQTEIKIKSFATKAIQTIDGIGIFAFEFFLTNKGELYLNESAPRPHNSGHYSLEGCVTSQFHNHVRSVFNLPLGETSMRSPEVVMLNLLGTKNGQAELSPVNNFLEITDGHLHLYGKEQSKVGRKMGHFTLLGSNRRKMHEQLKKLKLEYSL